MAITVAFAAGIINAAVVFLQLSFPLLIVFLLVGVLPLENNAITWSVVGRQLQGSFWPLILGSDSTSSSKVKTRVLVFSAGSTAGLVLLAVASVLTPLGLYQSTTDAAIRTATFVYAPDLTPIGRATRSRQDYRTSRLCNGAGVFSTTYYNCPGQAHGISFFKNATGAYVHTDDDGSSYLSSVPPANLSQIFGSGRDGDLSTVASALDIQYRSYAQITSLDLNSSLGLYDDIPRFRVDEYRPRSASRFYTFQSYVLADDWVIVDGLIANMKTGGIALRNHTIPSHIGAGVEWNEPLLWLEPESVCVDLNLTYQWIVPQERDYVHPMIVDNGGFANLSRVYPILDLNDTQSDPLLLMRAYKGALITDANLMRFFNTTRNASSIGKDYMLKPVSIIDSSKVTVDQFSSVNTAFSFAGQLLYLPPGFNSSKDITQQYLVASIPVQGFGSDDVANMSQITLEGGILMGAPISDDGKSEYIAEYGTRWHAPLYSCVTTLKASIMNFTFAVNGTSGLSDMTVKSAEPWKYVSKANFPLWAVEDTGYRMKQLTPIWGMVGNQYENALGLRTLRGESLYLPAGSSEIWTSGLSNFEGYAWGPQGPQTVLVATYQCGLSPGSCNNLPDYTGRMNYAMLSRWQNLTKSVTTAHKIFDLIWTDLMINYITSGRSKLTTPGADSTNAGVSADANSATASVLISENAIRYHMPFAVPGIIFLACYLLIVVVFLFFLCAKRATFSTLRSLSNQTAVGRAMTIERYNGKYNVQAMPTRTWIELHGDANLLINKQVSPRLMEKRASEEERSNHEVEVTAPMIPKTYER